MPATATSSTNRPETLIETLTITKSKDALAKVLREIKNQIIGNKTKKLLYLKLGAVPKIVAVLDSSSDGGWGGDSGDASVIVQAVASIGSFACGVEDGVRAVIDAGVVPHLTRILSHPDEKGYSLLTRAVSTSKGISSKVEISDWVLADGLWYQKSAISDLSLSAILPKYQQWRYQYYMVYIVLDTSQCDTIFNDMYQN